LGPLGFREREEVWGRRSFLPNIDFGGRIYQLGDFMSKELMLSKLSQFLRDVYPQKKPVVEDRDNTANIYRDEPVGWTIYRKRAWAALLSGSRYDCIDLLITVGSETGTTMSRLQVRSWMQHLSEFMARLDYVRSTLLTGFGRCPQMLSPPVYP
jgi:hypothetical protein